MKVALLFDGVSALGPTPDLLILESVEAIERAIAVDGHEVVRVPVNPDAEWIGRLRRGKFDLAFNLCEGIDGVAALEAPVIGVLELLALPFTGSGVWATSLCLRKHVINAALAQAGLPVPKCAVVRPGDPVPNVGYPAIVKPAAEDASIGVEQRSVVKNRRALLARVRAMHGQWTELLVQKYVAGREINVGILGSTVLPISEIDFGKLPRGMWPIVTYRAKWDTGSAEDAGTTPRCPAPLTKTQAARIAKLARRAWDVAGGDGYGRVDMRLDRKGQPWILEVNTNPDIAPDAGLARMARAAGLDYPALIRLVCAHAIERAHGEGINADRWSSVQELSGMSAKSSGARA